MEKVIGPDAPGGNDLAVAWNKELHAKFSSAIQSDWEKFIESKLGNLEALERIEDPVKRAQAFTRLQKDTVEEMLKIHERYGFKLDDMRLYKKGWRKAAKDLIAAEGEAAAAAARELDNKAAVEKFFKLASRTGARVDQSGPGLRLLRFGITKALPTVLSVLTVWEISKAITDPDGQLAAKLGISRESARKLLSGQGSLGTLRPGQVVADFPVHKFQRWLKHADNTVEKIGEYEISEVRTGSEPGTYDVYYGPEGKEVLLGVTGFGPSPEDPTAPYGLK